MLNFREGQTKRLPKMLCVVALEKDMEINLVSRMAKRARLLHRDTLISQCISGGKNALSTSPQEDFNFPWDVNLPKSRPI